MAAVATSQLWHLLRKDWRHIRWWILTFFLLQALPLINYLCFDSSADSAIAHGWMGHLVLVLALIRMFQIDSVAGSTSFLQTRPVARRQLLRTKIIISVLLVVVPCLLLKLLHYTVSGMTLNLVDYVVATGPELVRTLLFLALLLLPLTMLRQSLASQVAILVFSALAWWVAASYFDLAFGDIRAALNYCRADDPGLWMLTSSRIIIAQVSVIVAVGVTVWFFYRRHQRLATGLVLAALLMCAAVISYLWPWSFVVELRHFYEACSGQPHDLSVDPATIELELNVSAGNETTIKLICRHPLVVGQNKDYLLLPEVIDADMSFVDADREASCGSSLKSRRDTYGEVAVPYARHIVLNADGTTGQASSRPEFRLNCSAAPVKPCTTQVAEIRGTIQFSVRQQQVLASAPLRLGTRVSCHRTRLDIDEISENNIGIRTLMLSHPWLGEQRYREDLLITVVNRQYEEVLMNGGRTWNAAREYRRIRYWLRRAGPDNPLDWNKDYDLFPRDWLQEAEMQVLALPIIGEVIVPFRLFVEVPCRGTPFIIASREAETGGEG